MTDDLPGHPSDAALPFLPPSRRPAPAAPAPASPGEVMPPFLASRAAPPAPVAPDAPDAPVAAWPEDDMPWEAAELAPADSPPSPPADDEVPEWLSWGEEPEPAPAAIPAEAPVAAEPAVPELGAFAPDQLAAEPPLHAAPPEAPPPEAEPGLAPEPGAAAAGIPALAEVAERLERIAAALRQHSPAELLAAPAADPLELLLTGYALGYLQGAQRGGAAG